jgi:hypothetical protein
MLWPPRGRATIEVGIAGGATFMPEEPDVVVTAVPVVIVSATVIPSVAVVVFIVVGVLPVALWSLCPPSCPRPDPRCECLACRC